jgi:SecD/SecF fusion protein
VRRPTVVRALLALALVILSGYIALSSAPRLGLDLSGGTQIVLETRDAPGIEANAESTDRALEVLRERVDALGVAEPSLSRSGETRIIVELPGVTEPAEAAAVIGRTAQLSMHPVLPPGAPAQRQLPDEAGIPLPLGPAAITGDDVDGASAAFDAQNVRGWLVNVDFADGEAWRQLTAQAACAPVGDPSRRIAIVLDDRIISSPQVDPSVGCGGGIPGGSTQITGSFTQDEATDLAVLIEGGALPIPVEIIEQRTVGATLGAEAIEASATAALIGIALTGLFLLAVYRLIGAVAVLALGAYAVISYAALTALGATLTLPGLAGFVLAIGMAVDANVLIAERAREEYARKPRLSRAVTLGHQAALPAIADTAVTTLLAGGLLFFLASGPVRGFGVTLTIGVLVSLVSALLISRVLADLALRLRPVDRRPQISGISNLGRVRQWLTDRDPALMARHRRWLAVSGVVVALALAGIAIRGLELGVEFTGGRLAQYTGTLPDAETARAVVSDAGFPRAVVQESGDGDITVRASGLTDADVAAIGDALGGQMLRDELIGPSLSDELRRGALIAFGVALAAQLAYLAARFRWTFGAGAVAALFANVAVVTGVFAWLGKPIDGVFLAAVLTIIGYTVNDSVVVFDRVREYWSAQRKTPFRRVVSTAVLATLPRTVNTGLSTLVVLAALLLLGGDSLADFALALLLGIVVGTCSTVSVAAPLAVELESHRSAPPPAPKRKLAPSRRSDGAVV